MAILGIDVGGTFTDAVLVRADDVVTAKVLTTAGQEEGVVEAARQVLERAGLQPGDVEHFVHGSTVATNALLERRLARTALVTTRWGSCCARCWPTTGCTGRGGSSRAHR